MDRRGFVGALVAAPLMAWAGNLVAKTFQYPGLPSTNRGQFPGRTPPGLPGAPPMPPGPRINPRTILIDKQKHLRSDVDRLFRLAKKLRNQVQKTDSTEVLSLDMIHTAEKIEDLAKHIKDLARG